MTKIRRFFAKLLILFAIATVIASGLAAFAIWHISQDLPEYQQLVDYYPATLTRVHANDGRVMAEFAHERRIFVPIGQMPQRVINAFIAAEDKSFYSHPGISVPDILRASLQNLMNYGSNRRPIGASTITQQVARNFLLGDELSITRKIREALLAPAPRARAVEGSHPRALSQRDLPRRAVVRRRRPRRSTTSTARSTTCPWPRSPISRRCRRGRATTTRCATTTPRSRGATGCSGACSRTATSPARIRRGARPAA
jgi:hypothetical protein